MSDLFGLHLYFHVFTSDGDLCISDSADGDRQLEALLAQYPGATVITKDRETGKVLGKKIPLRQLLRKERGLLFVSLVSNGKSGVTL